MTPKIDLASLPDSPHLRHEISPLGKRRLMDRGD